MPSLLSLAAISAAVMGVALGEELCSVTPNTYTTAATTYPELSEAFNTLSNYSIATWYTDRTDSTEMVSTIKKMVSECSEDSRLSIVVYGLPNKDCSGGYSSSGSVTNTADYKAFLTKLTDAVGDRKVLYVVEPDAVGLLAESGGCGSSNGYLENLKVALEYLSVSDNADLYLDVGYWNLQYDSNTKSVVTVIKELVGSGKLKGIALNTSNYRGTSEISTLCTNFQTAYGSTDLTCIIDTSRNYVAATSSDWCNVLTAGIGAPPQGGNTGYDNLDYFLWIKVPGESDGNCNGGPSAGSFFLDGFKKLWDQGYFVQEKGYAQAGSSSGSGTTTKAPSTTTATPTATTATPTATTAAPTTSKPSATTATPTTEQSADSEADDEGSDEEASVGGEASDEADAETEAPVATTTAPTATTAAPTATSATTDAPASTTEAPKSQCKPKMRRSRKL